MIHKGGNAGEGILKQLRSSQEVRARPLETQLDSEFLALSLHGYDGGGDACAREGILATRGGVWIHGHAYKSVVPGLRPPSSVVSPVTSVALARSV